MKILFEGWFNIPHSYAIVMCSQLVALRKLYPSLEIFIYERKYFMSNWQPMALNMIYPTDYCEILSSFTVLDPHSISLDDIDAIYRATYPYDIERPANYQGPIFVFFTAEFRNLDHNYFCLGDKGAGSAGTAEEIRERLASDPRIHLIAPSTWSAEGLRAFLGTVHDVTIIPHGVDLDIYHPLCREAALTALGRDADVFEKIPPDGVVMANFGAMTLNKGLVHIFEAMHILINHQNNDKYRFVLKGTRDLYRSADFVSYSAGRLCRSLTKEQERRLFDHIIFIDSTLSAEQMCALYSLADVYVCPYLAEGFSITPLEALACGCKVVLPRTGSTEDYVKVLPADSFRLVRSEVIAIPPQNCQYVNKIDVADLVKVLGKISGNIRSEAGISRRRILGELEKYYSWKAVAKQLLDKIKEIVASEATSKTP